MMLCSESHVAYEWVIHGCCGWNIAATVLEGLSRALDSRRCAKVNLCENIARTQFHKDSWGDGITDMASCGITMCRWIAGIHPRIGKFPQICLIQRSLKFESRLWNQTNFARLVVTSLNQLRWFTQASVLNQDEVQHVEFSLGYTACRLEEGDQLRLHVCSAAHPRWLRHPLQPQGEDWLLGNSEVGRTNMLQDWWNWKGSPWTGQYFPIYCPVKTPHTRH